jgi:predicted GH43/DUF377 family glycosyl hydrolase
MKVIKLSALLTAVAAWVGIGNAAEPGPSTSVRPKSGTEIVTRLEKPTRAGKLDERDMAGYLLVYFKDETHSAYFAISRDGYSFTDINGGQPVLNGADIAEQKGVRDPHIARGPDGAFYLSMTDLHVNGQRAGVRTTPWERPEPQYGWGNNRALVLMKSFDLVHWTHADFRIDQAFPEFAEVGCIWAPQTIFDEAKGKMMIYFTAKIGRGVDDLYSAYTDDAFTKIETKPERYFHFPYPDGPLSDDVRNKHHVIDGDITKVGDKFHLFYSSKENGTPGIEHAVSDKINAGYPIVQKRVDPETFACEAPNVFKRIGTDTYVLMYDAYGAPGGGNMGFAETTDFVTFKNIGLFNAGTMKGTNFNRPKHGAVMHLTLDELKSVAAHWGVDFQSK